MERPVSQRFWPKVDRRGPNECWPWIGFLGRFGYGHFWFNGVQSSHRVAWLLTHGEIPDKLHVLHRCDNRACNNPSHLFLGTRTDNMRDCVHKGRLPRKGEGNGRAKLTAVDVLAIRERYGIGESDQYELAAEFGIGQSHVSAIVRGERWSHLP